MVQWKKNRQHEKKKDGQCEQRNRNSKHELKKMLDIKNTVTEMNNTFDKFLRLDRNKEKNQ